MREMDIQLAWFLSEQDILPNTSSHATMIGKLLYVSLEELTWKAQRKAEQLPSYSSFQEVGHFSAGFEENSSTNKNPDNSKLRS